MTRASISQAAYLIASLLFIFGLKRLSSPRTARSGNLVAAVGMALALGGTFLLPGMGHFGWILLAIVVGTVPGWLLAKRVKMTAMPQMVSLFNGMGGACALFISLGEWFKFPPRAAHLNLIVERDFWGMLSACSWALFSDRSVLPAAWSPSASCKG